LGDGFSYAKTKPTRVFVRMKLRQLPVRDAVAGHHISAVLMQYASRLADGVHHDGLACVHDSAAALTTMPMHAAIVCVCRFVQYWALHLSVPCVAEVVTRHGYRASVTRLRNTAGWL
jgi:hypothetical protein